MTTRSKEIFEHLTSSGGLLPSDVLERISRIDPALGGLSAGDYHLPPGNTIQDEITRVWNRLQKAWKAFVKSLGSSAATDLATSQTRERWLLVLFSELGFGRLVPESSTVILDGKDFPISHQWNQIPIHMVGARVELDKRTPGARGAARSSPHSLVQEYLNRHPQVLWGTVSNGLKLRLLRDNASLTRAAFVEFDLEGIFEGDSYSNFALLWLVCHQSRFETRVNAECWLETWSTFAREQGTRALEHLRSGVEETIQTLGKGFLSFPSNSATLGNRLRSGALTTQEFYRQLLRLVYRLIFLFATEDRGLLLNVSSSSSERESYIRFYSTRRLRDLARTFRGTRHCDIYQSIRLVMAALSSEGGAPNIALPPLNSFLWDPRAIPDLIDSNITNADFLSAIRTLAYTRADGVQRVTDYENLGTEELGGIYESLLELHPVLNVDAKSFELGTNAGHERKTTSSHYTQAVLIQVSLDRALEPILNAATKGSNPAEAILRIKVCDPAAGSGHFLVAAARRMAKRLATVRTGDEEPGPEAIRTALRDVIGHCLYGVDVNPMAVELCKVALWLEAMEPGKPLTFLEHRIQCGNSAIGTVPPIRALVIPDEAFDPTPLDDSGEARRLRKQNQLERGGQLSIDRFTISEDTQVAKSLATALVELEKVPDSALSGIHLKSEILDHIRGSEPFLREWLLADAWCAAFVSEKLPGTQPITQDVLRLISSDPDRLDKAARKRIADLAGEYRFFHWNLAFPDVFQSKVTSGNDVNRATAETGGFDLVLGNPPWDTLSPDVKEFFSPFEPAIRESDKRGQDEIVARLLEDPDLRARWDDYQRKIYGSVHFIKDSRRYKLFAPGNLGKGDFNIFRMFVETALQLTKPGGQVAQIVPAGFYSGANSAAIREEFLERNDLELLLGFVNKGKVWFPGVHAETRFCVYAARKGGRTKSFQATFAIENELQLFAKVESGLISIPASAIKAASPEAYSIPETVSPVDLTIQSRMSDRWPPFGDEDARPPFRHYMTEIHLGNDRELLEDGPDGIPVYEGRMVDLFDYRARAYKSGRARRAIWQELPFGTVSKAIRPQWFIQSSKIPLKAQGRIARYRVGFCDVATPTAPRGLIAALIPPYTICGHSVPTFTFPEDFEWAYMVWLCVANSQTMDFLVRQRVALHLTFNVLDGLPFPRLDTSDPLAKSLVPLGAQLACTGPEMLEYWEKLTKDGWDLGPKSSAGSPGISDSTVRLEALGRIEGIVARSVFGLTRTELTHVLDSFDAFQRGEIKEYGEYRSKRLALDAFDRLATN